MAKQVYCIKIVVTTGPNGLSKEEIKRMKENLSQEVDGFRADTEVNQIGVESRSHSEFGL